jgi:hypothetical protein
MSVHVFAPGHKFRTAPLYARRVCRLRIFAAKDSSLESGARRGRQPRRSAPVTMWLLEELAAREAARKARKWKQRVASATRLRVRQAELACA